MSNGIPRPKLDRDRPWKRHHPAWNFHRADLRDAALDGASFVKSELFLASFRSASLAEMGISFARLFGINLAATSVKQAKFVKAQIDEAEIIGPDGKSTGRTFAANSKDSGLLGANFAGGPFWTMSNYRTANMTSRGQARESEKYRRIVNFPSPRPRVILAFGTRRHRGIE